MYARLYRSIVSRVSSSPGPFPAFSILQACNIEKLGMGLGTRLIKSTARVEEKIVQWTYEEEVFDLICSTDPTKSCANLSIRMLRATATSIIYNSSCYAAIYYTNRLETHTHYTNTKKVEINRILITTGPFLFCLYSANYSRSTFTVV